MAKSTILSFSVLLVSLLAVVSGNPVTPSSRPTCITNTIVPAQVQLGPTRTLYRSTATCTSSLDCAGCSLVVKSLFPAVDIVRLQKAYLCCDEIVLMASKVPFRTTVTAEVTTTTAYVCHSCSSSDDDGKLRSVSQAFTTTCIGVLSLRSLSGTSRLRLPPSIIRDHLKLL